MSKLDEIRTLDPVLDHKRIVALTVLYEFPFDITRSLEFALFRTYAVPSISKLLDSTKEFYERPQKRYDDTDLIVSVILNQGYDSPAGEAALKRMNQMHKRFEIANEDFLYVLSTFIFEPILWNERYGWRRMIETERLALFYCWREIGKRMGISDIPETYEKFEAFKQSFEEQHFQFSETNRKVGTATVNLFLSWFPAVVRPLGRQAIYALMDEPLLRAFGFPAPRRGVRPLVHGALRFLAVCTRVLPKRRYPKDRMYGMKRRSYSGPYSLEDIGPPYMTGRK